MQHQGKPALPSAGTNGCKSVQSVWDEGKEPVPFSGGRFSAYVKAGDVVFVIFLDCEG